VPAWLRAQEGKKSMVNKDFTEDASESPPKVKPNSDAEKVF
jgi:hypothetical protein